MIFQESKNVRTIVGRLEEGDDCIEALTEFCRERDIEAAEVRAIGRFDRVDVVRFDPEADETGAWTPVFEGEGDFDVQNLTGNISMLGDEVAVRMEAILAADGPVAPQLVTGKLRSGRVVEFEFVMTIFDDLSMERRLDAETGLLSLSAIHKQETAPEPTPEASETPEPAADETDDADGSEPMGGQAMTWSDVAQEDEPDGQSVDAGTTERTTQAEAAEDDESVEDIYGDLAGDAPVMEAGDVLDHPKLGRCRVMKVEDGKYAHIRLPRGKIRKLSLNVVGLEFKGEEDGRHVFRALVGQ